MATGEVREGALDDHNAEFPMIASSWLGRQNRYSYHQTIPLEYPATFHGITKYDLSDASTVSYDYSAGVYGSESPFCPVENPKSEDDGYLVSFVTDTHDWSSSCHVFRADALADGPICTVHLPHRVPAGFHATWVPGASLTA